MMARPKDPNSVHNTPEYQVWEAMLERCRNPNHPKYPSYGGRGIRVCARWHRFKFFIADMGKRPDANHTLDRIDNDQGYDPSNCRWVSRKVQQNNMRSNRVIEYGGASMTLQQWGEFLGIKPNTILTRLRRDWPVGRALEME